MAQILNGVGRVLITIVPEELHVAIMGFFLFFAHTFLATQPNTGI